MSITVQALLEGAYNSNTRNDPGKLAQDGEGIAFLNLEYQRLWALMARARPDEFQALQSMVLLGSPPTKTFSGDMIDIIKVYNAVNVKVNVIPTTELAASYHLAPCVYRLGNKLVSRNRTGDPVAGNVLSVFCLDAPAPLTAMASVLDARFPARHHRLLIASYANQLSVKDAGRSAADRSAASGALQLTLTSLMAEFQLTPEAVSWIHASVERAGVNSKLGAS